MDDRKMSPSGILYTINFIYNCQLMNEIQKINHFQTEKYSGVSKYFHTML
jgi:hypothetical protein